MAEFTAEHSEPVKPTTIENDAEIEARATELATKRRREHLSFLLVNVVEGRSPFPRLGFLKLAALPRPGDIITLETSTGRHNYRVSFVNFDPYQEFQITLGCLPSEVEASANAGDTRSLKERMDEVIKWQMQVFERGQAFSNAMVVAGYAGIFGLWTFARPVLTDRTTDVVALLVGTSLFVYISWSLYEMIVRAKCDPSFRAAYIETTRGVFFSIF